MDRTAGMRWAWRLLPLLLLGTALLVRRNSPPLESARAAPPSRESFDHDSTEAADPELTAFANGLLRSRASSEPPSCDLDRFERATDPDELARLAIDFIPRLQGEDKERMIRLARSGDALHQEHALLALLSHSDPESVDAMLAAADLARPAAVADRALDGLLSVAGGLEGSRRAEALVRARIFADRGEPACRSTALLLLSELGAGDEDRSRLEASAAHPDSRVSLPARRALLEYLRGHGESEMARQVLESLSKEDP